MKMHKAGNKYKLNKQNKANEKHSLCQYSDYPDLDVHKTI